MRARSAVPLVATAVWALASHAGIAEGTDEDQIPDLFDKCMYDSRNQVSSCDSDSDGYGNPCDADFDQDFVVTASDFSMFFVPRFKSGSDSSPGPARGADMDCDGAVTANDFSMYFVPKFKGALGGAVPGPSGLACAGTQGCQ